MDEMNKNDQPSIFLVEDSDDCARMLKFLFGRQGFTVVHAKDGMEALSMLNTINRPSVVILDMMLPYVKGLRILANIRNKASWRDVPVVMLTGDGTSHTIVNAFEIGANDYVLKPYKPMELVARVKRLVTLSPSV
jgi:DNA-binding response OmpR family regulator